MKAALVGALALAACGGGTSAPGPGPDGGAGEELVPTGALFVVAHQGDELVYAQPDVVQALAAGGGVTTVYVTDGDLEHGGSAADRKAALEKAYTGTTDGWSCGPIALAPHDVEHCHSGVVSLVFMHYPSAGTDGADPNSLQHLYDGSVDLVAGYTRDTLIATINEVVRASATPNVHTLEVSATHGADHSDHEIVGAATLLAVACVPTPSGFVLLASHRGDNVAAEAPNVSGAALDTALLMLANLESPVSERARALVQRSYPIHMDRGLGGPLKIDGQCVRLDSDSVTMGDCTGAPSWYREGARFISNGTPSKCLQVLPTGEVAIDATCTESTALSLYPDDDGRIWSAVPPPMVNVTAARHLYCLAPVAGRVRAVVCGGDLAPVWSFDAI